MLNLEAQQKTTPHLKNSKGCYSSYRLTKSGQQNIGKLCQVSVSAVIFRWLGLEKKTLKDGIILLCINSCCRWCNCMWDIFLAHFDPFTTKLSTFKCQTSFVAEHVHPFMTTMCPSRDSSQSSNHCKLVSPTRQWVYCNQVASTVTRFQTSRAPLGLWE